MAATARGERALLECTADVSDASKPHEREMQWNRGRLLLLDFRMEAVHAWKISHAELLLHLAGGDAPRTAAVASPNVKWTENKPPKRFSHWRPVPLETYSAGWIRIPLQPAMLSAIGAGKSFGIALKTSEPGQRIVHSRETIQYSPYLIVEGSR